uniref:SMC hinge domain-containing protein n=1 Tax=Haptolina brevifila TaxID=156173 RepID=A0A7S2JH31_9EUKA
MASISKLEAEEAEDGEHGEKTMSAKQRAKYNELKAQAGTRTAALSEEIGRKKRELRDLEPSLVQHRTSMEEVAGEKRAVETKVAALEERFATGQERVKELQSEVKAMEKQRAEVTRSSTSARSRRTTLEGELMDVQGKIRSSKAEHRESERERKSAEAIENLRRNFSGVHGRITDIAKPSQRKYHAAVTIAMGKNMDAVVVDEEKVAIDCIAYLKEKRCPPETFIPLDSIRTKPVRDAMRQLGGTKKPVIDVVTAPEQFMRAIQFACADAIVCDTLDEARQLAYHSSGTERFKVVTLDGTLINKAGLITGGSSPGEKARANKWDQKEHETLKSRQDAIVRELEEIGPAAAAEERELALRHAYEAKKQELRTATADLDLTKTRLGEHQKDLSSLTSAFTKVSGQVQDVEATVAKGEAELQQLRTKCDDVEDEVFSEFSRSLGLPSIRAYEETHLRKAREREAERLALKQQQSKLQARVQFEKRKDLPAAAAKLRASIEDDEKLIAKKMEKQAKAMEAAEGVKEEATKAEEEAKEAKEAQVSVVAELKTLKKDLRVATDAIAAEKAKLTQIESDLEQQRSQRLRIFQRARLDEVEIPTIAFDAELPSQRGAGSSAASSAAAKKPKRKRSGSTGGGEEAASSSAPISAAELMVSEEFSPSDGLVGTGTLEGGEEGTEEAGGSSAAARAEDGADDRIRINFESIEEDARTAEADRRVVARMDGDLTSQIAEVGKQIDGMAPNMKAITQYEEVQGRLHSIESEFDTTRSAAKSVSARFAAARAKRYQKFMAAFKAISEAIDEVYKHLTKVKGVLQGGTAYLSLEDPDEPYLHGTKYTAMPAGKRFRNMDQLSGGERTVAALALLFAIHRFRPSPFFVMDEIDAALDNVNVTQIAQYIRERSQDGTLQFVVISLKDQFYHMAHKLVGTYRDRRDECSATATLDLERIAMLDAEDDDKEDEA